MTIKVGSKVKINVDVLKESDFEELVGSQELKTIEENSDEIYTVSFIYNCTDCPVRLETSNKTNIASGLNFNFDELIEVKTYED